MRLAWNFLVIILAFVLQNTLMPLFQIFGIQPDLVLVTVVCFSFIEGQVIGGANGFLGGLFQDFVSLRGFGVNALSLTIIGYGTGLVEQTVFAGNLLLVIPAVTLATILSQFLYVWLAFLVGYQVHLSFLKVTLPTAVYNGLLSPLVFIPLARLWEKYLIRKPKGVIS